MSAIERLDHILERLAPIIEKVGNTGNQSTITINAGGWGVLVCAIMCAFMCGLFITLLAIQMQHGQKLEKLDSIVSAIYQQAPSLRPKEITRDDPDHRNSGSPDPAANGTESGPE